LGPALVGFGVFLIFGGIVTFLLDNLGPMSKLWWPDRPTNDRVRFLPRIFIGMGIVLIVVGAVIS